MEEGSTHAQLVAVADGAADDAAQHKSATFVAGDDAVADEETTGADMICQHFQRRAIEVAAAGFACSGGNQLLEQVDLVIGVYALQYGGDALQTHAGIDRRFGQRMHHTRFIAVELHEDVVPDFDETVAVFIGRARRPARNMRAVVVENLGTGAAGACIAHHPEVVRGVASALVVADADDTFGRHTDLSGPDIVGFVVF